MRGLWKSDDGKILLRVVNSRDISKSSMVYTHELEYEILKFDFDSVPELNDFRKVIPDRLVQMVSVMPKHDFSFTMGLHTLLRFPTGFIRLNVMYPSKKGYVSKQKRSF